jgi:hypothetical protein
VQHPKYDDPSCLDQVEDRERVSGDNGTANLTVHIRKHLGIKLYAIQRRPDRGEEFLSQPRSLFLVPVVTAGKIKLKAPAENYR